MLCPTSKSDLRGSARIEPLAVGSAMEASSPLCRKTSFWTSAVSALRKHKNVRYLRGFGGRPCSVQTRSCWGRSAANLMGPSGGGCVVKRLRGTPTGAYQMSSKEISLTKMPAAKPPTAITTLMTPNEAASVLKVSLSWLAKARMRGDGPLYIPVGRSIRYAEAALIQWMKSKQRSSTSEQ